MMNTNKSIPNLNSATAANVQKEEQLYERHYDYKNDSYDQEEDEQLNYEDILYRGEEDGEEYKVDYDDEEGDRVYDDRDRPQIPQRSLSPNSSERRLRNGNLVDSLRQSQQESQKKPTKPQQNKENEKVLQPIDQTRMKNQNNSRKKDEREPHFSLSQNEFEYEYSIQNNRPNKYSNDSPHHEQNSLYEDRNQPKLDNSKAKTYTDSSMISGNNRAQKNQPLFIEQLVSKNLAGKSISQDKSYYQQQEFLSQSNRGPDASMQVGSPPSDANSQSVITINVLAQQIASLQKQVEQAQQQQQKVGQPPTQAVTSTNIQTNPREVEALLQFLPPEEQKKLLMHLLLNKQLLSQNQSRDDPEQILSSWKPVIQQAVPPQKSQQKLQTQPVQPVSQAVTNSNHNQMSKQALRDQREFTPPKKATQQPGVLQRTQSNNRLNANEIPHGQGHVHGKSTVEIERVKRKQEEQLMDDLIRKQEITIKNLQMERSLNKITKSSPKRTQLKGDSSKTSFSPPKYTQQFNPEYQQQQQSLQHQSMKYQQLQLSPPNILPVPAKKQRTKWGEQQPSQQSQQQQSQAAEDFETIPAKKISDISRQEKEDQAEMEEIKRRLKQDFNNYLQQSKLNTLPGRQQQQQRVSKENSPSKAVDYNSPTGQQHEFKQGKNSQQQQKQLQVYPKWEIPIEKKSISPIAQSRTPSPFRDARNKKASPIRFQVSFQDSVQQSGNESLAEMFKARRWDLSKKKQSENDQRKRDRSAEELKRARSIPKSKEELAMLRKDLMHQTRVSNSSALSSQEYAKIRQNPSKASVYEDSEQQFYQKQQQKNNNSKTIKDPPPELLNRLIHGIQAKIDKKDYQKLTMKNYEQLPEIKRKKEEEKKKMEQLERIRAKKEYEQVINQSHQFLIWFQLFSFGGYSKLNTLEQFRFLLLFPKQFILCLFHYPLSSTPIRTFAQK